MVETNTGGKILDSIGTEWPFDLGKTLRWAAQNRKMSVVRMAFDVFRREINRQKLTPQNYFSFGLHLARYTNKDRAEYIGDAATTVLNAALSDQDTVALWRNKVATAVALETAGLPTPAIRAVFSLDDKPQPYPHLSSQAALEDYFSSGGNLPFFGKAVDGHKGLGAASFVAREGSDRIVLGDGRVGEISKLATELAQKFPHGYIFQDRLRQHPDMVAIGGQVMCTLRITSLWVGGKSVPLYANLRLPAPGAMLDLSWSNFALVDHANGRILRTSDGTKLGGNILVNSQVTGAPLIGAQLPFWPQVLDLSEKAHALFPKQGVIGLDFALTEDGPLVVELNANPGHGGFHKVCDKGLLNPQSRALLVAALAERGITRRGKGMPLP